MAKPAGEGERVCAKVEVSGQAGRAGGHIVAAVELEGSDEAVGGADALGVPGGTGNGQVIAVSGGVVGCRAIAFIKMIDPHRILAFVVRESIHLDTVRMRNQSGIIEISDFGGS